MPDEQHLHFLDGFTGRVLMPDGSTITVEPLTTVDIPEPATAPAADDDGPTVDDLLRRYERLNPHVNDLYEGMTRQGFRFYLPHALGGKASTEYLRALYKGKRRRLTLYINSASLTAAGQDAQEFAVDLPGTEMRVSGAVFRYNRDGGVDLALEWSAQLIRWADHGTDT